MYHVFSIPDLDVSSVTPLILSASTSGLITLSTHARAISLST
jgi:hypothetical protein